jgi:hypothetical protein
MWRLNQDNIQDNINKVMSNKSLVIFVGIVAALAIYNWFVA